MRTHAAGAVAARAACPTLVDAGDGAGSSTAGTAVSIAISGGIASLASGTCCPT